MVAASALLVSCPQLLDDHFRVPDAGSPGRGGADGLGGIGSLDAHALDAGARAGGGSLAADDSNCPFGAPEPLTGLGLASGSEFGPALSADALTLVFASTSSGQDELFKATRLDRGANFSLAIPLTDLNTASEEGSPFLAGGDLRLYFCSTRAGGLGGQDLYVAQRADVAATFSDPRLIANVNSASNDHLPRLSRDELTLVFTSTRPGGQGGGDLWRSTRPDTSTAFATPTPLDGINGSANEESGGLTRDGLTVFFDSTRTGGIGGSDIWMATRADVDAAFSSPVNLGQVNSAGNEYNVILSLDEREMFFSSSRMNGSAHHLYRSLRRCE